MVLYVTTSNKNPIANQYRRYKISDVDIRGLYFGNTPIKQLYHGSTLVFQQKQTVTRTITHYNANDATVSGSNFWTTNVSAYSSLPNGTITYYTPQREGTWSINYPCWRQANTQSVYMAIDINYIDGTSERVYYKNDFPNDNNTYTYTGTFIAAKQWNGYKITFSSGATSNVYCYSGLGAISYISTSYQEIIPV
jgi:hypothetical protein